MSEEQTTIIDDTEGLEPEGAVQWAVVANFADDPHPHVLDTFAERGEAELLMDDCAGVVGEPSPVAWTLWKLSVDAEPELVSP